MALMMILEGYNAYVMLVTNKTLCSKACLQPNPRGLENVYLTWVLHS
jgi:hypothetical protein